MSRNGENPLGFKRNQGAEKRAFIRRQFTEGKFDGTGQFFMGFCPPNNELSIYLAKFYYLNKHFNVQIYESIPANRYIAVRRKADMLTINIHSFMKFFVDRRRKVSRFRI
jgi:hypothetical protein